MATLRDRLWLWGHPEGLFNNNSFGNNTPSRMTPMEFCANYGLNRTFMVPCGREVNRRQYNKSFKALKEVVWDCYDAVNKPELLERNIEEAKEFNNITGVIFDDMHRQGTFKDIPLQKLWDIKERLHNNEVKPLTMWMVIYTIEFGKKLNAYSPEMTAEFLKYIEPFDGVTMWSWEESTQTPYIPEKWEELKALTPGKKRMFGCYLWNFGESCPATGKWVKWQLDFFLEQIKKGDAEGIILHTNTMADLDLEAYDVMEEWLKEHINDEVPEV